MKHILHTSSTLLFVIAIMLATPHMVLASEGDAGDPLELEVNGYHVTLASENNWAKGENTLSVTLTDSMGMPVNNAEVEILVTPKAEAHTEPEADAHGTTDQQQDTMPGMDMGNDQPQESSMPGMDMGAPAVETSDMPAHAEENASPVAMTESENGMYSVATHLESSGEHEVHVMFHANGEMLQADFVVEVTGKGSKTIVLWSFVMVNIALVASAGIMKKRLITVKGGQ